MRALIKKGWKEVSLGDLFRIKHGYAFKGEFFVDSGDHILLTPGNFEPQGGLKLKGDKEKFYSADFPKEYLLSKDDLLIVMTDLTQEAKILGSPAFITSGNRYLHNQRLGKIIDIQSKVVDPVFIFYLFNSDAVRGQLRASATGATVRHTAPERIYAVKANIPPLPIQRRITTILSAYDDLIENNSQRIQILEEMAQRIYEEWFVRFRFPRNENFKMVESELGLIPDRWETRRVTQMIEFYPQTTVPKEGMKPFVPMSSLAENSMLIANIESRDGNSGSKFKNGDTLFARITPCLENGKTGFVNFLPDDNGVAFGSTEFIVLRSKTVTPEFVYLTARSDRFRQHAIKSMSGATGRQRVRVDSWIRKGFCVNDRLLFLVGCFSS